jgi:hypothetical protein
MYIKVLVRTNHTVFIEVLGRNTPERYKNYRAYGKTPLTYGGNHPAFNDQKLRGLCMG